MRFIKSAIDILAKDLASKKGLTDKKSINSLKKNYKKNQGKFIEDLEISSLLPQEADLNTEQIREFIAQKELSPPIVLVEGLVPYKAQAEARRKLAREYGFNDYKEFKAYLRS